jgi:hypothetical protein
VSELERRLRWQAEQCRRLGSPLTHALLDGAADDLAAGGVVADVLGPHAEEPSGSVPSLRLAGSLHRLVLEQVGRAAVLYGGLALLGSGPVRLLEIGASAGLNLRCDAFAYDVGDGVVVGDPASRVRLSRPWEGAPPLHDVRVVERRGCDPSPVDPTTTEGRLTLTSYVWADQVHRLERLRAALEVAHRVPVVLERSGALAFLDRALSDLPDGVTTVVWHSVVWQYLETSERDAVDALIATVGATATERRPLARLSMEPTRVGDGEYAFEVHLQTWPGGERVHVADCEGHGPPVRWMPDVRGSMP